jgi:putative ABC transport system permease protein
MCAETVYKVLLYCYPAAFRHEYGDQMALLFSEQLGEARRTGGQLQAAGIWLQAVLDAFIVAPKEHWHVILQDLRYALRQLRKSPGFTAMAVMMLAIGIGATTSVFSVVEGVLLRPLPFRDASQLVAVTEKLQGAAIGGNSEVGVTAPDLRAYLRDAHAFQSMGGYEPNGYELSGAGEPSQVNAARLGAGVFPTLGVAPVLGRVFTQQEDDEGQPVAVLSYLLWQTRFHGDPRVLGSKLLLNRKPFSIIGVMPRNFEFPLLPGHLNRSELWVPLYLTKTELSQGAASWNFQMVARLKPGITPAQAETDAERVAHEIMRNYPAFMASLHITAVVRLLQEDTVARARPLVRSLFLAVTVVLLIACANLAGLLLVRAMRRRREFAVRLALGASSGALLRQAILESLALSVSGGLIGIALAVVSLRGLTRLLPETLPRIGEISLSWPVIAFALFLGITTGALCGLAPAVAAIRTSVNETLKEGGRTGYAGGGLARLRSSLVVAEISIALVLLTASGLLLRSFERMRSVELGFRPERVTIANYSLPQRRYASQAAVDEFDNELLRRLGQLPGAEFAGLTSFLPTSSPNNTVFVAEGYVPPKGANMSLACVSQIQGNFFRAMGIPLLRGRFFTESDRAGAPLVVIVNRKLTAHYWPRQDPIGKRLRLGTPEWQTPWLTVVGEVADVKQGAPDVDTQEQYYQPMKQYEASIGSFGSPDDINGDGGFITVRTGLPPEQMETALRSTIRSLDPQLALTQMQTMEQAVADSEAPRRFNTALITAFAAGSVLLSVLGIYGVIAFSVALRTQEMAIRMALGSQRAGIIGPILVSGARLAAFGCGIGLLGAWAVSRLLRSFLFQVDPLDPLVLALAVATVFLLAVAASVLPAGRAASIDPVQALRME